MKSVGTSIVVAGALAFCAPALALGACVATSGAGTGALVELYSSEGCSSCPPIDRLLMGLTQGRTLVPLALHVGYWDGLGWKDSFARPDFARRQEWLAGLHGRGAVYTPQLFVGGRRLEHGHVVRVWIGPLDLEDGKATLSQDVPVDERWQVGRLEIAAFVQDREEGRVLQAVGTGECLAGGESQP